MNIGNGNNVDIIAITANSLVLTTTIRNSLNPTQ